MEELFDAAFLFALMCLPLLVAVIASAIYERWAGVR